MGTRKKPKYTGVREFNGGGWCAVSSIDGQMAIIYTADSEEECAAAYNQYAKLIQPRNWEANMNEVSVEIDLVNLFKGMALIGNAEVKAVGTRWLTRIEELKAQGGN